MRDKTTALRLVAVLVGAASVLDPAAAQTPAPAPPERVLNLDTSGVAPKWYQITLQHADTDYILKLMHWNKSALPLMPQSHRTLPEGVQAVFGIRSDEALLVQATAQGYERVRQITRILDVAQRAVAPFFKFTAFTLTGGEATRLPSRPTTPLTFQATAGVSLSRLFQTIQSEGRAPGSVFPVHQPGYYPLGYAADPPEQWVIGRYLISDMRVGDNDSLNFAVQPLVGNGAPLRVTVLRSETLALRNEGEGQEGEPLIISIQVGY